MHFKVIVLFAVFLSGCVKQTYDYVENYDPNEKIFHGYIVKKIKPNFESRVRIKQELDRQHATDTFFGTLMAIGTGTVIVPFENRFGVSGNPNQYYVSLDTGKTLRIYNHFTGFKVGECVKVFISENWKKYPARMAIGGECESSNKALK